MNNQLNYSKKNYFDNIKIKKLNLFSGDGVYSALVVFLQNK